MKQQTALRINRHGRQNTKPAVEFELSWTTTILIGLLGAMCLFTSFPL